MSKVAIVTGADRTIRTGPDCYRTFTAAADHAHPCAGVPRNGVLPAPLTGSGRHHNWAGAGVSTSLLAHLALDPGQHRGHAAQPKRAHHII
jgi:hypothetical protein